MKNKKQLLSRSLLIGFFMFIILAFAANTQTFPTDEGSCEECHPDDAEGYTIEADVTEFQVGEGEQYTISVTGTGSGLVINVMEGAGDNDLFVISPQNIIEDNGDGDSDSASDAITVELVVQAPDESGEFTLRIFSMEPTAKAGASLDIIITVGTVTKTPLELFFSHTDLYLGGISLIFVTIGLIIFQVNVNRKNEFERLYKQKQLSKKVVNAVQDITASFKKRIDGMVENLKLETEVPDLPDIKEEKKGLFKNYIQRGMIMSEPRGHFAFIVIAFVLMTINLFLIITSAFDFSFGLIEGLETREMTDLANFRDFNMVVHILLGTMGYIAGIVIIVGTYSEIPGQKLKLPIYILFATVFFNYIFGIFVLWPIAALGG